MEASQGNDSADRRRFEALLEEIEARAASEKLDVERTQNLEGNPGLRVWLGDNQAGFRVGVFSLERAETLLAAQFERYRIVPGYEAIYSEADDLIEARLRSIGPFPVPLRRRKPFDEPRTMAAPNGQGQELELATASEAYCAIAPSRRIPPRAMESAPVLRLKGFDIRDGLSAKRLLDDFGPTVAFELDIVYDVPVELVKSQDLRRRAAQAWQASKAPPEFPANEYDSEPVALYLYGRSARGMPLLEYLAYYQAIEFYFPRYAAAEVRRRVERIVKDPRFNPHFDRDVGRLVEVVQGQKGRTYGPELEQLKMTLRSCVESDEIQEFIRASEEREEFFRDRRSSLTGRTISLLDRNTDLRDAVATRVYDLRCRIVHTKDQPSEHEPERLLPNSPEAQLLENDIALLRLLAVRVIVASSRELTLDRQ